MSQIESYTGPEETTEETIERETEGERGDMAVIGLHPKLRQVLQSRKVWAGLMGLGSTLGLWWLGEIDGARAVEALTWVLGIFIGSVALEDGMTRLFGTLAHAVAASDARDPREGTRGEHEESTW